MTRCIANHSFKNLRLYNFLGYQIPNFLHRKQVLETKFGAKNVVTC